MVNRCQQLLHLGTALITVFVLYYYLSVLQQLSILKVKMTQSQIANRKK